MKIGPIRSAAGCLACCLLLTGLAACSLSGAREQSLSDAGQEPVRKVIGREKLEGRILGRFASGARFARLEIGMSRSEVETLIGVPDSVEVHSTGTAWVPYYFGADAWSIASNYKGEGRLVFNADSLLILIDASGSAR